MPLNRNDLQHTAEALNVAANLLVSLLGQIWQSKCSLWEFQA